MENHNHEQRFSEDCDIVTKILDIFQSNCDIINHHLYICYKFDVVANKYISYFPNVMRHHVYVDKYQVPPLDYKDILKEYKAKPVRKKRVSQKIRS